MIVVCWVRLLFCGFGSLEVEEVVAVFTTTPGMIGRVTIVMAAFSCFESV